MSFRSGSLWIALLAIGFCQKMENLQDKSKTLAIFSRYSRLRGKSNNALPSAMAEVEAAGAMEPTGAEAAQAAVEEASPPATSEAAVDKAKEIEGNGKPNDDDGAGGAEGQVVCVEGGENGNKRSREEEEKAAAATEVENPYPDTYPLKLGFKEFTSGRKIVEYLNGICKEYGKTTQPLPTVSALLRHPRSLGCDRRHH